MVQEEVVSSYFLCHMYNAAMIIYYINIIDCTSFVKNY